MLVATSVAEEGLDIPSADLVIFYEPVGSEIRTIQRRGRTGRHREGEVMVLVAEEQKMRPRKNLQKEKKKICKELFTASEENCRERHMKTYQI